MSDKKVNELDYINSICHTAETKGDLKAAGYSEEQIEEILKYAVENDKAIEKVCVQVKTRAYQTEFADTKKVDDYTKSTLREKLERAGQKLPEPDKSLRPAEDVIKAFKDDKLTQTIARMMAKK